ncbi:FAD-dependent thymidylate synthase [Corynebacterium tapiri]|uniref:FAD-dependent thymidylate synthase n=1 Tax=Corynebacterium tapiri TaxID=1448266 RepID=A0A5C4U659_9CORY|nr:FAD-dependent thymidylate synthase [Corynebacterium tapiri]TNL99254.1 FAD-dependent thymidylate synthase [Corynebacterium tapiri]
MDVSVIAAPEGGAEELVARVSQLDLSPAECVRYLVEIGQEQPLEHAHLSVQVTGIARGAAWVVRTLDSARGVNVSITEGVGTDIVVPQALADQEELAGILRRAVDEAVFVYRDMQSALLEREDEPNLVERKRMAEQVARYVVPGAMSTNMVITANLRQWRALLAECEQPQVDEEVKALAESVREALVPYAPTVFARM